MLVDDNGQEVSLEVVYILKKTCSGLEGYFDYSVNKECHMYTIQLTSLRKTE